MATGNLNDYQTARLTLKIELIDMLLLYPNLFPNTIKSYLRDIYSELQLSRSKDGFESKLQRSSIQDQRNETKITEASEKKRALFGKR